MTCKKCGSCACIVIYKNKTEENAIRRFLAKYPKSDPQTILDNYREHIYLQTQLKKGRSIDKLFPMPTYFSGREETPERIIENEKQKKEMDEAIKNLILRKWGI